MKTCNKCQQTKPEEDFPRYPNSKTRPRCKVCANEATKRWMAHGKLRPAIVLQEPAAVWATRAL